MTGNKAFEAAGREAFWSILEQMTERCEIVIDRPKGSRHPVWKDLVYPLDYGYLAGTASMDGEGIDVWVGTAREKRLRGVICTADALKRDSEIKLLFACTDEELEQICRFTNARDGLKGILVLREPNAAASAC